MQLLATRGTKSLVLAVCTSALALALCFGAQTAQAVEPTTSAEAWEQLMVQQAALDEASNRYFAALGEYQDAQTEHDAAAAKLDKLERELSKAQERLSERARELYRSGAGSWMEVLLGSTTFHDFIRNLDFLNFINENDAALVQEERDLRTQSREQQAILAEQLQRTSRTADEAYEAFKKAEELTLDIQAAYERLNAEEQAYIAQQAALEASQAADDQMVADAIAASGGTVNSDGSITDAEGNVYSSPYEYSNATGSDIVARALSQLGASYVWGGVGGSWGGFDCSGFVSYALTGSNTRLGTTADFNTWNEVNDPQPGDVCVIHEANGNQHTGIYLGDGKMVHASDEKTGVVISDVQKGMKFVRQ